MKENPSGDETLEKRAFSQEIPLRRKHVRCFVKDCHNVSVYLTRLKQDNAIVQASLCNDCLNESHEHILRGLGLQVRIQGTA